MYLINEVSANEAIQIVCKALKLTPAIVSPINNKESETSSSVTENSEQNFIRPNNLDHPIEFSDNVIILPNILGIFSRPLWVTNPTPSFNDRRKWSHRDYINQGEILYQFNVRTGSWFFTNEVSISIFSPISGLLLDAYSDIQMEGFFHNSLTYTLNTKLLVPKNQRIPIDASEMYREFCTFCSDNPEIFSKGKFGFTITKEELIDSIERQAKAPFRVLSLRRDFSKNYFGF